MTVSPVGFPNNSFKRRQVQSGEGFTWTEPTASDVTGPADAKVAAKPQQRQPRPEKKPPSAHAAYAAIVAKKYAEKEKKEEIPDSVMVHITNISQPVTKKEVETVFSRMGVIKIRKKTEEPNVWIGEGGREASVTYEDPLSAQSAVEQFNDKDVFGHGEGGVSVKLYNFDHAEEMKNRRSGGGGGQGGRGGGRGGGGGFGSGREGDWPCGTCGNVNFARRDKCNKCQAAKPAGAGGGDGGGGGGGYKRERDYDRDGGGRGGGGRGGGDDRYGDRGGRNDHGGQRPRY
jgi:hypothetical protein